MFKICSLIKGFYLIVPFRATRYLLSFFLFWLCDVDTACRHCRVWLGGGMHTAKSDSAVSCTSWSCLKAFVDLTLRCDAHRNLSHYYGNMYFLVRSPTSCINLPLNNISLEVSRSANICCCASSCHPRGLQEQARYTRMEWSNYDSCSSYLRYKEDQHL